MKLYSKAQKIIDKLVSLALQERFVLSDHRYRGQLCSCKRCTPGSLVERALNEEEREALKELKSEEVKNVRPLGEDL